jgi:hypothetical protein
VRHLTRLEAVVVWLGVLPTKLREMRPNTTFGAST